MQWPAKIPDPNPIENMGLLARRVYANARQFANLGELWACVLDEWDKFDSKYIYCLLKSMQNDAWQCWRGGVLKQTNE